MWFEHKVLNSQWWMLRNFGTRDFQSFFNRFSLLLSVAKLVIHISTMRGPKKYDNTFRTLGVDNQEVGIVRIRSCFENWSVMDRHTYINTLFNLLYTRYHYFLRIETDFTRILYRDYTKIHGLLVWCIVIPTHKIPWAYDLYTAMYNLGNTICNV